MKTRFLLSRAPIAALAAVGLLAGAILPVGADRAPAGTPPSTTPAAQSSLERYAVPAALRTLEATVVPIKANKDVLNKIGKGFAEGYNVKSATYTFTAPDRVEVRGHYGILSADVVYTNTSRQVNFGFIHQNADISRDLTKRQTIYVLGLLPQNYLDTVRVADLGQQTINGIACSSYLLRFISDGPNDARRWQIWVSRGQHYIVKLIQWGGDNVEHQTVFYLNPVQAVPGVWVPTQVQAYDTAGELGGTVEQRGIRAS